MTDTDDGPPRAVVIAALAVAVGAIGVILAIAATRQPRPQPMAIPDVASPHADDPACRRLLHALPQRLGDYQRSQPARPAPGIAAWRSQGEAVVLRCGLQRPAGFVRGSSIQTVDNVQWFEVRQDNVSTWYTVDRPVYVALTLPPGSGPTPIQQLSELIDRSMPAVPIRPG
jgi:hypothetical protein